jgi:hypothetical protein
MDASVKISNSKLKSRVHVTKQQIIRNRYKPKIAINNKVYIDTYYNHQLKNVVVDETPTKIKT